MRIIAGELRGRLLEAPDGRETRPMLDRVREAIFSTLAPWLPDARVLDLFAGSGSLGLEALSRGARIARMIERDREAFSLLKRNIEQLGMKARTESVRGDALDPEEWGDTPADIVFLDPPYPWLKEHKRRASIFEGIHMLVEKGLADEGVVVFHAPRNAVVRVEFGEGLELAERTYGSNSIWYVARSEEDAGSGGHSGGADSGDRAEETSDVD